jgi:FtsP/CotA-like multicopper oxidase with cupredoxin domain
MFVTRTVVQLVIACTLCLHTGDVWADADEYTGQAWNPISTAAHPCGIGIPQRGNFPRDRLVNARKPTLTLTVRQEGAQLCYVIDGIAEAPVIRVHQGQTLNVTLRNEITDPAALAALLPTAGKRERPLASLPHHPGVMDVVPGNQPLPTGRTNLHMHGFAVPPVAPQDEVMMGCADPPAGTGACGQQEITYRYQIPSDMPAGLYWYHPHVHGEVQAQMLAGLTGAIVVEGPDDEARNDAGIPDRVFIVRQRQDTDRKTALVGMTTSPVSVVPPPLNVRSANSAPRTAKIDTQHELGCINNAAVDEISLNGAPVLDGISADKDLAPLTIV